MASPDSRGREVETTSSWEEQQSPAAKGMDSGKDEIVGPVVFNLPQIVTSASAKRSSSGKVDNCLEF